MSNEADETLANSLPSSKLSQTLRSEDGLCAVTLAYHAISSNAALQRVGSPFAGANVLFVGTTRDSFDGRPVSTLSYSAYPALALKTFLDIATTTKSLFGLEKVYIEHRLGTVEVEEESIAVAVSAAHRGPAWRGAEEVLERCKERAEIWKMEQFKGEEEPGQWRANKDSGRDGKPI